MTKRIFSAMKRALLAALLLAVFVPGLALADGSQSYTAPGTYYFTVPSYGSLTVYAYGAGGGGGGTACSPQYSASPGSPGGASVFYSSTAVAGYGGGGGQNTYLGPGPGGMITCLNGAPGTPGGASGGDSNTTGGGAGGGMGGNPSPPAMNGATGGQGGAGGAAAKTFSIGGTGAPAAGSTITVVVGGGGAGGAIPFASLGFAAGANGGNGSVTISWASPSCTPIEPGNDIFGRILYAFYTFRLINFFGINKCVSNNTANTFFVPVGSYAETQSFIDAAPRLNITVQ